jgi:hypothetical protein
MTWKGLTVDAVLRDRAQRTRSLVTAEHIKKDVVSIDDKADYKYSPRKGWSAVHDSVKKHHELKSAKAMDMLKAPAKPHKRDNKNKRTTGLTKSKKPDKNAQAWYTHYVYGDPDAEIISHDWVYLKRWNGDNYVIRSKDHQQYELSVEYMKIIAKYKNTKIAEIPVSTVARTSDITVSNLPNIMKKAAPYMIREIKKLKHVYVATGKTFDVKNELKKDGMKWSPNYKVWYSQNKPKNEYTGVDYIKLPEKVVL